MLLRTWRGACARKQCRTECMPIAHAYYGSLGACRKGPALRRASCRMRMCRVDFKERACTGKAGGAEMGPTA